MAQKQRKQAITHLGKEMSAKAAADAVKDLEATIARAEGEGIDALVDERDELSVYLPCPGPADNVLLAEPILC
ncbi:hypothetical protein AB0E01_41710 [Nocardia vinacea]|uniref:hypothetical protein n=1 Tax=Nocardia vinacea TaxID=96468 RepID=UPI0033DB90FB